MSRTRTEKEQIEKGLVKVRERRQGQVWVRNRIGPEAENLGELIKGLLKKEKFGKERVKFISDSARGWLEEQGLPNTAVVCYRAGEPPTPVPRKEFDLKKGGVAVLDNFLEKLGYGYWDDERLAARLVMHAEQILDPGLDVDVIEEMRRFTETLEYLRQFRAVDARTGKPRKRKSLGSYIREVLKKDGRGLSPKVVWQILEAKGVVRENETGATAWKGGVVRWESFCNAVYRERKKLKNLEN